MNTTPMTLEDLNCLKTPPINGPITGCDYFTTSYEMVRRFCCLNLLHTFYETLDEHE